jgi:putative transposase
MLAAVSSFALILHLLKTLLAVARDGVRWLRLSVLPSCEVAARLLLAEKQLAMYQEREVRPQRAKPAERVSFSLLSRLVSDWRQRLVVVKPDTVCRWHREIASWLWRRRSHGQGRPPLPCEIRAVSARIHAECPGWSARRIRDEARLKLGVRVSEATVRKYLGVDGGKPGHSGQRWATFIRNHADQVVACDLFTVWTASFHVLYVIVFLELGSRRLIHLNVTSSTNAFWVRQQLREAIPDDHGWRFLLHDRGSVFNGDVKGTADAFGLKTLLCPPRAPVANAFCERLIGTLRLECLDHLIILNERHLRAVLREYAVHYNHERPHMSLGPGIPDPPEVLPVEANEPRHSLPAGYEVVGTPVLNGLHFGYRLRKAA